MGRSMTETLLPVDLPTTTSSTPATAPVTAVVVTRGLTTYLPTTLAALAAQTRRPLRIVLVDAGESPDQQLGALLEQTVAAAGGAPQPALRTISVPGARTFGDAVGRALARRAVRAPVVPARVCAAVGRAFARRGRLGADVVVVDAHRRPFVLRDATAPLLDQVAPRAYRAAAHRAVRRALPARAARRAPDGWAAPGRQACWSSDSAAASS